MRSVVGSLSWISREARPDILYGVFRLQSSIKGAKVSALTDANKVLKMALDTKDLKIRYRHSGSLDFMKLGVLTASEASLPGKCSSSPSRDACIFCAAEQLTDPNNCLFDVSLVSCSSTTIKRVCRATLQAETYALQNAQEAGDKIRAALAEMYGHLSPGPEWYGSAIKHVPHIMLSDCRSLVDHLNVEVPARVQVKRLQIELNALRQAIFLDDGTRTANHYPGGGDRVDWCDTHTQVADYFTKSMKADFLVKILATCSYEISRAKL